MSGTVMDPTRAHVDAVLGALLDAQKTGKRLSGPELVDIGGWRFGAVIFHLRNAGYPNIKSARRAGRIWEYWLEPEAA